MGSNTLDYAKKLDRHDVIAPYREEFYLPQEKIYMDGNSLGLLSKRAEKKLFELLDAWKTLAIDGWTEGLHPWYYMAEQIGGGMAPLVGGKKSEVIATGSTTTNLHQMISTFYRPSGKRTKILADELNFPSDIYALQSQIRVRGLDWEEHLIRVKSEDGLTLDENRIIDAMAEDVALIVLPSVLYRSGQVLDMKTLTQAARERGIIIGFDLSHSIGSVTHALHEWDVDFAFWCTYKHLNGGPGSVGGLFVNERHFGKEAGLAGWFGSDKSKQFDMNHTMTAATDAGAYQIGTPHILSLAPLLGSLEMFEELGMEKIRRKSLELTSYMLNCIENELSEYAFGIGNPLDDSRGGHLLLQHKDAARICQALKAQGVVPDFRAPDGIRLAPVALYNSFEDVWQTVQILKNIMQEDAYKQFPNERGVVA